MARLLKAAAWLLALAVHAAASQPVAPADRHQWTVDIDVGYVAGSSELGPWPDGALGKLRYDADENELGTTRLLLDYAGRLTPALTAHVVADYVDDATRGADLTEAYLQWQPVPGSALRQHWRFGAMYPRISFENGDRGWASPFTTSFSAINAWLGEEIRPLGAEWTAERRLRLGSPHEIGVFAAGFYANDPAGTLLFWRGFALHDRQTRLNDRLAIPPRPVFAGGTVAGHVPQTVEPFDEIDDRPGYYAGLQWQYAQRARLQLSTWDNRADPSTYADGQWSWRTKFRQLAAQLELPGEAGLVAQWMRGATYWYIRTGPNGTLTPASELVEDEFEAYFVLLTKRIASRHRVTLRYDNFDMQRPGELEIDAGHAWTFAYRLGLDRRMSLTAEWLEIDSKRGLWDAFYAAPNRSVERQVRVQWRMRFGPPR